MIGFIEGSLERNSSVFEGMLTGIAEPEYRWREGEGKWNLLEIVCHLYDEEREDFRARLHSVLTDPDLPFKTIDPAGWVTSRHYDKQGYSQMVVKFLNERKDSIAWLQSLKNPHWENEYLHPQIGPMSGKFIIANWLAHDFLHIRQITRIRYNYLKFVSGQELNYAGDWL